MGVDSVASSVATTRAWIVAVHTGAVPQAWALTARQSQSAFGGYHAFVAARMELAEGWGAWATSSDAVYHGAVTAGRADLVVVTITGTVSQEGPPARRSVTMPVRLTGTTAWVSPFERPGTVLASPAAGPAGTHVHIEGYGFTDAHWRTGATSDLVWLAGRSPGCDLYASALHTVAVTAGGHLTGDFVVPATGDCRQASTGTVTVAPGRHQIIYQCTACAIGSFDVTPQTGTGQ